MKLYSTILKSLLFIVILYYLFSDIDIKKFLFLLEDYFVIGILIAMLSVVLSDIILARRWQFLSKYSYSFIASFEVSVISGFLNFILPAKLGEISKLIYLKRLYNVKFSNSMIVLFIERSMDVFILAIISLIATNLFLDNDYIYNISIIIIVFMISGLFILNTKFFQHILHYIPIRSVKIFLKRSVSNITRQLNLIAILSALGYSSLLWLSYFFTVWLFLEFAANIHLLLIDVFIVFTISSIAMSLPLAPGGVGTYQAGLIFALGLYDIDKEVALAIGIMLHIVLLTPSVLLALWVINKKSVSLEWFKKEKN